MLGTGAPPGPARRAPPVGRQPDSPEGSWPRRARATEQKVNRRASTHTFSKRHKKPKIGPRRIETRTRKMTGLLGKLPETVSTLTRGGMFAGLIGESKVPWAGVYNAGGVVGRGAVAIARACRPEGRELVRGCALALIVYDPAVTALKAHIVNGRIVVDEPVDLPDGAEVQVYLYDASAEAMSADERAALERALERSLVQADAGELIEADEVLAELQRP